ncbi:MAG: hypothetical protein Q8R92_17060 [Deltaproteobacteria bacterium]|nr:hypothetical protein [Deltaproteobacteria bacterium]
MNSERRWIGVFSALLLLLGIFIGIAMDRFLFRPGPPRISVAGGAEPGRRPAGDARHFLERLTLQLDLTDEQRGQVEEVFNRNIPRFREARGNRAGFQEARRQMWEELAAVLGEEQMKQLDELRRSERDEHRKQRGLPPGPGAPPRNE